MGKKFFMLFFVLCAVVLLAQEFPRPYWLHYPENDNNGLNVPRYFWTDVVVPQDAVRGELICHFDDEGRVYINGRNLAIQNLPLQEGRLPAHVADLTPFCQAGNPLCLELMCINRGGIGGAICRGVFYRADGSVCLETLSSTEWKAFTKASWEKGEIVVPAVHGDLLFGTWLGAGFDMEALFGYQEGAVRKSIRDEKARKITELKARLLQEPKPEASVFYRNDLPMIRIGEEEFPAMVYSAHHMQNFHNEKFVKGLENFRDAGLRLYVMGAEMKDIWKGPGQYDFSCLNQWPYDAFLLAPEGRLLFDIDCRMPPRWWMDAHPEELIEYLVQGEPDYWTEYGANFVAPSFASELYKKDVYGFLKAMVDYVEAQPWASRVFGYRYDMGVYMEWHYNGMDKAPDNSKPMQKRFHEFLRRKYGTDKALQSAWSDNSVTLATAPMANLKQRTTPSAGTLYDPVRDIRALDSVACIVESTADFLLGGDHVIKEACNRRCLVGNFYGYFFDMPFAGVGQHFLLKRLLESPDVDFNSQPPAYGQWNRRFGEAQFARGLTASYRFHNKLYLMEADTRTHEVFGDVHCFAETPRETVQLMARDFGQALCGGFGFWYFDFGNGWYPNPLIGEYLKKLLPIWNDTSVDTHCVSEAAIVIDMDSVIYHSADFNPSPMLSCNNLRVSLAHTGAAYDTILFSDLLDEKLHLPDYKVYIFLDAMLCTPERIALAKRLRDAGKTLVWLQQAGYLVEGEGASVEAVQKLTGFRVAEVLRWTSQSITDVYGSTRLKFYMGNPSVAPVLGIRDKDATPMLRMGKEVVLAGKPNEVAGKSYLGTHTLLLPEDFQAILHEAGVHIYCEDENAAIYASNGYILLHVDKPGTRVIHLPKPGCLTQLLPEYRALPGYSQEIAIEAEEKTTYIFRVN